MLADEAKVGLMKVQSLFREEGREKMGGRVCTHCHGHQNVQQKQDELGADLGHLIYLKKRGVVLLLITVKDGSFP